MDASALELDALKTQLVRIEREIVDLNVKAQMLRDRIVELQKPNE